MDAFYNAQREYAEQGRNDDGVREYARRFTSRPGKHDGVVCQKNLGDASAAIAKKLTGFEPDPTWVALPPP